MAILIDNLNLSPLFKEQTFRISSHDDRSLISKSYEIFSVPSPASFHNPFTQSICLLRPQTSVHEPPALESAPPFPTFRRKMRLLVVSYQLPYVVLSTLCDPFPVVLAL